ncbi:MAG: O-antigen ligase family protein, partial [Burkholderiales bacterium]|nr:O-antigen ligase family protein [Burkholderiales bacterium]
MGRQFQTREFPYDRFFFWSWAVILVWAPIPLGSNRPWAWSLLELLTFGLAACWLICFAMNKVVVTEPFRRARWFLALLALWLAYQALFILPMPQSWVALLSPQAAAAHELVSVGFEPTSWMILSVDPNAAKVSWLKSLLYVLSFAMTLLVVNGRDTARRLGYVLVIFALVLSVVGLMMHLTEYTHVWFGTMINHAARASATYPNPNHFAGFLEMTLAIGIGLLIAGLRDARAQTWKQFLKHALEWIFSPKMRLRLMLCVIVIALVSTHSRMGNTAFFASMIVVGLLGLALSRHATRGTVILLVSLIAIDVFIVGSWFGLEKLANRIEQTAVLHSANESPDSLETRAEPAKYGIDLIADYPLFGAGPGSWYVSFPRYRGGDLSHFFDYAHNDFVQFVAESGLIGGVILFAIVAWSLVVALIAQFQRRDPLMRGLSFVSIMGVT